MYKCIGRLNKMDKYKYARRHVNYYSFLKKVPYYTTRFIISNKGTFTNYVDQNVTNLDLSR